MSRRTYDKLSARKILNAFQVTTNKPRFYCDINTGRIYSIIDPANKVPGQTFSASIKTKHPVHPHILMHELQYYPAGRRGEYRSVRILLNGGRRNIMVHRVVWMVANNRTLLDSRHIDHIDRDTVNNRHTNLRALTHRQNIKAREEQYERDRQEF